MHRVLKRQLRKLGLTKGGMPEQEQWQHILSLISGTYQQSDDDRYLLERSLQISSDELHELFQQQKASTEGRLRALVNALPDLVFMLDEDGRYLEIIASNDKNLYLPANQLRGRLLSDVMGQEKAEFFVSAICEAIAKNSLQLIEYELSVMDGDRIFEGRIMPTGLRVKDRNTVVFLSRDITEIKQSRNRLEHIATHDALTGLPNRTLLEERMNHAIAHATRVKQTGALMVLDLDRFKQVNDSLGHHVGDQLLVEATKRLRNACRDEDTLVRFGGDEFVFILENLVDATQAGSVAQHVLEAFAEPIHLAGFDLDITASIGISVFPQDGEESGQVLRQADNAMYAAKNAGRNQYSFYTEELGQDAMGYLAVESSLRKAIKNCELVLEYQPQFNLSDGALVGLEALVRWPNAEPAYRYPESFIPIAEMSGLIEPLGLWVLDEACRQAAEWSDKGYNFGRIAVNLSSRQLNNPKLADQLRDILQSHHLSGSLLELEITESMVVHEGGVAHANLEAFAAMGVRLAIDDFGTGHSSLVNLKRFPLSRLKIDRSFVDGLGDDSNDEAITGASIALAKQLGLEAIAEGVETQQQLDFLHQQACAMIQGYLYAKPLSANVVEQRFFHPIQDQ